MNLLRSALLSIRLRFASPRLLLGLPLGLLAACPCPCAPERAAEVEPESAATSTGPQESTLGTPADSTGPA